MKKTHAICLTLAMSFTVTYAQTILPQFPYTNGSVWDMVKLGNTIYIGGDFTSVIYPSGASFPRHHLAAFNAITGEILPWNPEVGNTVDLVNTLAAANNTIYIGSQLFNSGTQPFNTSLVAVDAITGAAINWPINWTFYRSNIHKLLAAGNKVYVSGGFQYTPTSEADKDILIVLDAITGQTVFTKNKFQSIFGLAVFENTLFVGGDFVGIDSLTRYYIAALDATNGSVLSWNPAADFLLRDLQIAGSSLYAAGQFTGFGYHPSNAIPTRPPVTGSASTPINKIAAFDISSGTMRTWDPKVEGSIVQTVAVNSTAVYLGGSFTSVGGVTRNNIALVDAVTGAVSSWNPNPNESVFKILADGNSVFVLGSFRFIAGQSRFNFAALSAPSTLPVITCPANITTVNASNACTQLVSFAATASGSPLPSLSYRLNNSIITSPYNFPVGTSTVTATATSNGGVTNCTFTVTVNDTQVPSINNLSTSITEIWPANKKMKDVWIDYTTMDNCPAAVTTQLAITSNEQINTGDWKIIDNHHIQLKADRLGNGNGRIYTITITATDQSGNKTTKSTAVTVPHDQGKSINVRGQEELLTLTEEVLVRAQLNPSRSFFTLTTQSSKTIEKINLRLYDISGRLLEVKSVAAGQSVQMGKTLNAGIYLLEYSQAGIVKQIKLIKQ